MAASREVSFWPQIDNPKKAEEWMHYGAVAAGLYAATTAGVSYLAICLQRPVLGFDGWGMADALVFAVMAWRVHRSSVNWAIAGLLFFTVSKVYWVGVTGHTNSVLISSVFFLLYLHAARAGFYLRNTETIHVAALASQTTPPAESLSQFARPAFALGASTDLQV